MVTSYSSVATTVLRSSRTMAVPSSVATSCIGGNYVVSISHHHRRCITTSSPSHTSMQNHTKQFVLPNNYYHQQIRHFARLTKRGGHPRTKYSFEDEDRVTPQESKNILVIGSSGILGKTLVSNFGIKHDWNVLGADILESDTKKNSGLCEFISLPKEGSIADLTVELYRGVSNTLQGGETNKTKLDAVVCASGGWAGDVDIANVMENHLSKDTSSSSEMDEDVDFEEEYARESAAVCERMMRMNYYPIVAGSQVVRRFMKQGGLFVVIGASAALSPTPGMLGYGSAKAATHHYLQSFGPTIHDETDTTAVGILPLMIDTPNNRAMLDGDGGGSGNDDRYSKMVNPIHIANEIGDWIKQPHLRPHSGSLVKVIAKNRRDGSGGAAFHLVR